MRRHATALAALTLSVGLLAACGNGGEKEDDQPVSAPPITVGAPASDGGGDQGSTQEGQEGTEEPSAAVLPAIGQGDPMLGVHDGIDRPELSKIPTDELESSDFMEQSEKFRRLLASDSSGKDWNKAMQSVADPSFAASLSVSDRDLLREAGTSTESMDVTTRYSLGTSSEPYASATGLGADGEELWTVRMSFAPSKADRSIGTWRAVSIDWPEGSEALKSNDLPFTEDTRATVLTTAAYASSSVFTQAPGDDEKSRAALVGRYFLEPKAAAKIPVPFPERNVTAIAGDPIGRYFVTPAGSSDIWVEINNTSHVVSQSGDPDPDQEPAQNVVYVKLSFSDGNWMASDAQEGKP